MLSIVTGSKPVTQDNLHPFLLQGVVGVTAVHSLIFRGRHIVPHLERHAHLSTAVKKAQMSAASSI
jgi:hypothetical protein